MATDAPTADDLLARMNTIAPPSSGAASAPAAQSSAPSSDDLLSRMNAIAPPPQTATTTTGATDGTLPYAPPLGSGVRNVANAFVGGIYTAGANLASNLGMTPNALPPDVQTTMASHPYVTGAGNLLGQGAIGLPIGIGAGVVAPMVGIGADLGGAIATGGAAGAVQNVLAGDPNQSWYQRAGTGALEGAVLGGVTHKVFDWLGPEVAASGAPAANALDEPLIFGVNPLSSEAAARANARAATAPPEVRAAGPAPMSPVPGAPAGAQVTPSGAAAISPQEAAAYRSVAEVQKLTEPQPVGVPDTRQLVPGEDPTLTQIEQNAATSRELKALRNVNPQVQQMEVAVADRQNAARADYFKQIGGSDVDLMQAQNAREANGDMNAAAAWRNKGEADPQPVADFANTILSGPDGKRDVIVRQLGAVRDKLFDANGNPETDPEMLYGVRKDINDRLSKEAVRDDATSQRAAGLLIQMRQVLDNQIEAAAPGFRNYLQQWHADSQPIDSMSVLQKWEPKLFDTKGKLLYSKFSQMMREAVISRRRDMPLNDWQSVPDDKMQQLWDLRDSLRRAASADELAAARGSDTAPNSMDILRQYGKLGGNVALHGVANMVSPGWGSVMVRGAQQMLNPLLSARASRQQLRRAGELLSPPPGNPLSQ